MEKYGILSRNYYIDPDTVSNFGAEIYNMMMEADQAMAEASEVIAEIASLTERVPSQIRYGALLEACETAQAEIKSVDFFSYGQKVNQGLQNLLDHNQYITEHFIKNMETHTEKMRGLGEEFRRLADSITYAGSESAPLKGITFSAVSNVKTTNIDEKLSDQEEERLQNDDSVNDPVSHGCKLLNSYLNSQLNEKGECIYEDNVDRYIDLIKNCYPWMLSSLYVTDCYSTYDSRIVLKQLMEIVDILQRNENVIKCLEDEGKSIDYIIHMLIELREQYPEFYYNINQSSIDEIIIYCRYVEMNDMVAVACEEVDKPRAKETVDNNTGLNDVYYNDWYYGRDISDPDYAWCSVFVLWCANEVNLLDGELFPTYEEARNGYFEGVGNLRNYFKINFIDRYHSYADDPDYIPCVGDFVFMQSNRGQNHVGIVVGYDNEKNIIYTVEGNSGDKVSLRIRNWDGGYVKSLVNNGGDVANIPENIEDFENGDNSSTR